LTSYKREPDTGAGSRTFRAGKKPFVGQPPNYVGPRRIDRLYRAAARSRLRRRAPLLHAPSDDELEALFLTALAEDCER
jgi:hypothetical protein